MWKLRSKKFDALLMCTSCSTVVEHTPHGKEFMGSNPAGCWAFFFFSLSYQECVPHRGATLLIFLLKTFSCAAWGEASLITKAFSLLWIDVRWNRSISHVSSKLNQTSLAQVSRFPFSIFISDTDKRRSINNCSWGVLEQNNPDRIWTRTLDVQTLGSKFNKKTAHSEKCGFL